VLRPEDVEVDRLLTLLLVELRPVERLEMPLVAVLRPDDVEVDRLLTLLLVELKPVERLEIPLVAVLKPDEVEVDKLLTLLLVELKPVDRLRCRWSQCSGQTTWMSTGCSRCCWSSSSQSRG
jgi:hypothetical protein